MTCSLETKFEIRGNLMNTLVKHIAGSKAYGTDTPESDTDIRGIFLAEPKNILTPFFPVMEKQGDGEDEKYYELRNYMKLYCEGNPNILETLWVDWSDVLEHGVSYLVLREAAEALLSKKVAFTFSGYAFSQLQRIKGHNKWINNPQPIEKPKHKDFVKLVQSFGPVPLMPRDFDINQYKNGWSLVHYSNDLYGLTMAPSGIKVFTADGDFNVSAKQQPVDERSRLIPHLIIRYCKEEYTKAVDTWNNYWQWKNNRNEKRAALEERHHYDTKNALHCVRLLKMGEEILSGQGVIVKRPDAKELLDIRNGAWQYDDLVKWAEEKDRYIRGKLYEQSKLPKSPNIKLAASILMDIQQQEWRLRYV